MAPRSLASKLLQAQLNQLSQSSNAIAPPSLQHNANPLTVAPTLQQQPQHVSNGHLCYHSQPMRPFQQSSAALTQPFHILPNYQCQSDVLAIHSQYDAEAGAEKLQQSTGPLISSTSHGSGIIEEKNSFDIMEVLKDIRDKITEIKKEDQILPLLGKQVSVLESIHGHFEKLSSMHQEIDKKLDNLVFFVFSYLPNYLVNIS